MQKTKICKTCQRHTVEIGKRVELLNGIVAGSAGYTSTQILCDKYTKLLTEHMRVRHEEQS